jgi:hypothetical protein
MARRRAQTEAPNGTGTITKTEAVRRALAGGHQSASDARAFIKKEFGLDISSALFYTTKSQLKRKPGASGNGRRKGATPSRGGESAQSPGIGFSLVEAARAVAAVQALVRQFGKDAVKQLVEEVS